MTLLLLAGLLVALPEGEGLQVETRLLYEGHPDSPHRLIAIYQAPDRVRWHRRLEGAKAHVRDLEYRSGERLFVVRQGSGRSEELSGRSAVEQLARFELRRALFSWPDGFDWRTPEEDASTMECAIAVGEGAPPLAFLTAVLDASGKPSEMRLHWPEESPGPAERLLVEGWKEMAGRPRPASLRLDLDGRTVWREELISVSTRIDYVDVFFVPPDRRVRPGAGPAPLDLIPHTRRRIGLEEGASWAEALARFDQLVEEERRADPDRRLDPTPTFELDRRGRPGAVLLRLQQVEIPPPPGWETLGERPGWTLGGLTLGVLDGPRLQELFDRASGGTGGAKAIGPCYGRVQRGAGEPRRFSVQLFLPLVPSAGGDRD